MTISHQLPTKKSTYNTSRHESLRPSTFSGEVQKAKQLVSFAVGGEDFGIDILSVQEIIRPVETTSLPYAPDFVEGMINLRGRLIPIVDLHTRLGFPQRDRDGETKFLVVELKGQVVGLVTGSVSEVLRAQEETIEPAPDLGIGENAVQEVAKLEGRLLLLLSPEGLFSEEETKALEKTKPLQSVEEKEKVAEG